MKNKTPKWLYEPCRECGAVFGEDGRSFEFKKGEKPICSICKMKKLSKSQLQMLLEFILKTK